MGNGEVQQEEESFLPFPLVQAPRTSHIPQHRALCITQASLVQAPATQAWVLPNTPIISSGYTFVESLHWEYSTCRCEKLTIITVLESDLHEPVMILQFTRLTCVIPQPLKTRYTVYAWSLWLAKCQTLVWLGNTAYWHLTWTASLYCYSNF